MKGRQRAILIAALAATLGYAWLRGGFGTGGAAESLAAVSDLPGGGDVAILAGGCFWCVEADFDKLPGVTATISGYTGGRDPTPSYETVSRGVTGHAEAVAIHFNPKTVGYAQVLDHFWKNVDPFAGNAQFCDVGSQYRAEIFVRGDRQKQMAEASKASVEKRLGRRVTVRVTDAAPFYPAEEYHQNYAARNPVRYGFYRWTCGRDRRLAEIR